MQNLSLTSHGGKATEGSYCQQQVGTEWHDGAGSSGVDPGLTGCFAWFIRMLRKGSNGNSLLLIIEERPN